MKNLILLFLFLFVSVWQISAQDNVVFSDGFENGIGNWAADETWNKAEISTETVKSGTASLQGRRDSDKYSNHGLIVDFLESVKCFGDGNYKLKFNIYLGTGFDRNTDLTIFKNGDRTKKDYGKVVTGIDKTITGAWQAVEVDFTFSDVDSLTGLAINISTWGGTPYNPGIPFWIDDVTISTLNENKCNADIKVAVDYTSNQITVEANPKVAGDIWARGTGDLVSLEIIDASAGPAGYTLTDKILKVEAGEYINWHNGIMFEFKNAIAMDTISKRYLHVAYYIPSLSTDDNGAIRNWLKGGGVKRWQYSTADQPGTAGTWFDLVYDITNDTIQGLSVDHFEFMGYPKNAISYIGSIEFSDSETPRILPVLDIKVAVDYTGNQITVEANPKVAGDIWARGTGDLVSLEIIDASAGPAGYTLTDKILKVEAGEYINWHNGIMFEFKDSVVVDTISKRYLHVAYYIPSLSTDDNGAIRNWLKGGGVKRWQYSTADQPGTAGTWFDLVYDITSDTIQGLSVDHFEFMGYPKNAISYIGSIEFSDSETPRIEAVIVEPTVPNEPTGLSGKAVSNTEITLTWTDNSDDETMFVVKQKDGENWSNVANLDANVTSATISNLDSKTTYTFVVVALNNVGESVISNKVEISTLNTGINSMSLVNTSVYPNPTHGMISISEKNVESWKIMDLSGRMLMSGEGTNINVSELNKGLYIINIELNTKQMVISRFVKD